MTELWPKTKWLFLSRVLFSPARRAGQSNWSAPPQGPVGLKLAELVSAGSLFRVWGVSILAPKSGCKRPNAAGKQRRARGAPALRVPSLPGGSHGSLWSGQTGAPRCAGPRGSPPAIRFLGRSGGVLGLFWAWRAISPAMAGDGPGRVVPRSGSGRGCCGCRGDKRAGRRPGVYGVARALEPVPGAPPGNEADREQA